MTEILAIWARRLKRKVVRWESQHLKAIKPQLDTNQFARLPPIDEAHTRDAEHPWGRRHRQVAIVDVLVIPPNDDIMEYVPPLAFNLKLNDPVQIVTPVSE